MIQQYVDQSTAPVEPKAPKRSAFETGRRYVALAGKGAATGLTGIPAIAAQAGEDIGTIPRALVRQATGLNIPTFKPLEMWQQGLNALYGGIQPETMGERLTQDVTTAIGGGSLFPGAAIPTAVSSGLSGLGAGTAREAGLGPTGQFIAGSLAPMGPYAAMQAARLAGIPISTGSRIVDAALMPGGEKRAAGRIVAKIAGEGKPVKTVAQAQANAQKIDEIVAALNQALPEETAAQAAVKTGNAPFVAAGRLAEQELPSETVRIAAAQEAARRSALQAVTPDEQAAVAARAAITDPMRQIELNAANTAGIKAPQLLEAAQNRTQSMIGALQNQGRMATEAQQAAVRAQNYYPVSGLPRVSARYSPLTERVPEYSSTAKQFEYLKGQRQAESGLRQYQLESLAAHGLQPLKSQSVIGGINKTLGTPGIRASDVAQKSLQYIRDKIASLTDDAGVIDANDLYTVRKEIGNVVSQFAKETNNWDKRLVSGIQANIQKSIDDAIEQAGGTGWKNYLAKYAELSAPVNQSKVLTAMQTELAKPGGGERVGPFLNVLGKGEQALLKKSTGFPRAETGDLGKVLTPEQMQTVNKVAGQLERDIAQKELAEAGTSKMLSVLRETERPDNVMGGVLERNITITNNILRILEGKGGKMVDAEIARLMQPQNKQELIQVLIKAKPGTKAMMVREMAKSGIKLPASTVGALLTAKPEED
jgi:hypothetical protein